jgi:hypothetical protein
MDDRRHAITARMTLFEWAWARWRNAAPVPGRGTALATIEPATPDVAAPYLALYTYLQRRYASTVVLTFEQVEYLLGCALPPRARSGLDWWTNPTDDVDRHSDAWKVARRTATPNLPARTVAFERLP